MILLQAWIFTCIFFVFGALNSELFIFLGTIGLSVSFNGGVRRKNMLAPARSHHTASQTYAMELN